MYYFPICIIPVSSLLQALVLHEYYSLPIPVDLLVDIMAPSCTPGFRPSCVRLESLESTLY